MGGHPRIIIGLGTGRCGTKSLSEILGVTHEAHPLPWLHDERLCRHAIKNVLQSGGDVGCYWLNYVDRLLELRPDAKFVCLRRGREATVKSWVRRFEGSERFALSVMHMDKWGRIYAPLMFPDYGDISLDEAAGRYWDGYYERAEELQEQYPESFRIYWMDKALGDRSVQKQVLRFAGIEKKTQTDRHANKGGTHDPEFGNLIREMVMWIIQNDEIYKGMRATLTPPRGSRLGVLAVEKGISQKETDDIVMDFTRLTDKLMGLWVPEKAFRLLA